MGSFFRPRPTPIESSNLMQTSFISVSISILHWWPPGPATVNGGHYEGPVRALLGITEFVEFVLVHFYVLLDYFVGILIIPLGFKGVVYPVHEIS